MNLIFYIFRIVLPVVIFVIGLKAILDYILHHYPSAFCPHSPDLLTQIAMNHAAKKDMEEEEDKP